MNRVAPLLVALLAFAAPDVRADSKSRSSKSPRTKAVPKAKPLSAPTPTPPPEPAPPAEEAAPPAPPPPAAVPEALPEKREVDKREVPGTSEKREVPGTSSPSAAEKPKVPATSVEALRAEYDQLRDALFRSRARRETLETALFSTQLLPTIVWDGGRRHIVKHAEVRFDGVRLWESGEGFTGDKPVSLSPKSAPPGPHVLGVRVEVRSRDNPKLGYVSDQSFAITLPEGKKTAVEITVDEDGDAPSYNPDIEIEVESK